MAVRKTIVIDGKSLTLQASASTPRLYRDLFHRDMLADMDALMHSMQGQNENASELSTADLEIFENAAYTMAKQADKSVPDDIYTWLDRFEIFSIYAIMPHILELWGLNEETLEEAKKKNDPQPTDP